MGRNSDKKRAAKKRAKAIKRKKQLAARTPPPAPTTTGTRPTVRLSPVSRRRSQASALDDGDHVLWEPGALSLDRNPGPPWRWKGDGEGPELVAFAFPGRRFALYPRDAEGHYGPTPVDEIPVDQPVSWQGQQVYVEEPTPSQVSWSRLPSLDNGVVRATLLVQALVWSEDGHHWSPQVSVEMRETDAGILVDADVVGGGLAEGRIKWSWATSGSHAEAVAGFIDDHAVLFNRLLRGETGLDGAFRAGALAGDSRRYKLRAVEDVVEHAEQTTAHLLAVLDGVPEREIDLGDFGPLYALSALAHLREREAHPRLLALARMDVERFEEAFSGFLTEQFDAALLRTAGGELDGIRALVVDRAVDGYLRAQAAEALAAAVALGQADREEVLKLLASQLTPDAAEEHDYLWTGVVGSMMELDAVEYEAEMVEVIRSGLVEPGHIYETDLQSMSERSGKPNPRCLAWVTSEDPHVWMGWWHCFKPSS